MADVPEEFQDIIFLAVDERTEESPVVHIHSAHPFDSCASEKIKENSLDVVVKVMSEGYSLAFVNVFQAVELFISQFPAGHFN